MINLKDIPFILYLCFMSLYLSIGDGDNKIWSGVFFCFNYFLMFFLFKAQKRRIVKILGMDISISLFIFSIIKFFTTFECEKFYTFVPFIIILIGLAFLDKWRI